MLCSADWNNGCRPCLSLTPAITTSVLWHDQESTGKSENGSLLLKKLADFADSESREGLDSQMAPFLKI